MAGVDVGRFNVAASMIEYTFGAEASLTVNTIADCFWIARNHFDPCGTRVTHNVDTYQRLWLTIHFHRMINMLNMHRTLQHRYQMVEMDEIAAQNVIDGQIVCG